MPAQYELNFDMKGSGFKCNETAGEALGIHKLVYRGNDGYWHLADADDVSKLPVLGITMSAIASGKKGEILQQGYIGDVNWTWTAGALLYASDTAGELSQTTGTIDQLIAVAQSPTLIYFNAHMGGPAGVANSTTRTITAGNTDCGGWTHGMNSYNVACTPIDEPNVYWWLSLDDLNNVTVHIASPDLQNNHQFRVLAFS